MNNLDIQYLETFTGVLNAFSTFSNSISSSKPTTKSYPHTTIPYTDGSGEEIDNMSDGDSTNLVEYIVPIAFAIILFLWIIKLICHCYNRTDLSRADELHGARSARTGIRMHRSGIATARVFPTSVEDPYYSAANHVALYGGEYGRIFLQPTPPKYEETIESGSTVVVEHQQAACPPPYHNHSLPTTREAVSELRVENLAVPPPTYQLEEVANV